MNFILKIVEGPNKGAEIALVAGVAVTLGKTDDCDIVLADPSMPEVPLKVEASESGVQVDGDMLDVFHVKTAGSTAFAVGPAESAWGDLVWPAKSEPEPAAAPEPESETKSAPAATPESEEKAGEAGENKKEGGKRTGCLGCLVAVILLAVAAVALVWLFRDNEHVVVVKNRISGLVRGEGDTRSEERGSDHGEVLDPLERIAREYGLELTVDNARATLSGNFKTRAERLKATAEAYAGQPGVNLDLSDDESLRVAAEDELFTLTEGAIKVAAATNRVVALEGVSRSAASLRKTLAALAADMPKIKDVDVSGVVFSAKAKSLGEEDGQETVAPVAARKAKPSAPAFPVCGILTKPYPCLVMQNGMRVLEGASIGENTILKIEADSVTVTNSNGRFTWKP